MTQKKNVKFVVALRGINRAVPSKPGKRGQYKMIAPGTKIPVSDFSPEELERKLASGAVRYLRDKDPESEPGVVATTGKDHLTMDVGLTEVPDEGNEP